MKKIYLALCVACLLLLAACGGGQAEDPETEENPDAQSEQGTNTPDENESGDDTGDELPIEVSYPDYSSEISWESVTYEHEGYSFEMPADWTVMDGADYGLMNGVFLLPPDTDMANFPLTPNVAIETTGPTEDGVGEANFADEAVQKDFFAAQIVSTYSKMGGLDELDFQVWQGAQSYVYMAQFTRKNDTLTMYQTTHYPMLPGSVTEIQAAYFDQDAQPPVCEVARHIADTISFAE